MILLCFVVLFSNLSTLLLLRLHCFSSLTYCCCSPVLMGGLIGRLLANDTDDMMVTPCVYCVLSVVLFPCASFHFLYHTHQSWHTQGSHSLPGSPAVGINDNIVGSCRQNRRSESQYSITWARNDKRYGDRRPLVLETFFDDDAHEELPFADESSATTGTRTPLSEESGPLVVPSSVLPSNLLHSRHSSYTSHSSRISYTSHGEVYGQGGIPAPLISIPSHHWSNTNSNTSRDKLTTGGTFYQEVRISDSPLYFLTYISRCCSLICIQRMYKCITFVPLFPAMLAFSFLIALLFFLRLPFRFVLLHLVRSSHVVIRSSVWVSWQSHSPWSRYRAACRLRLCGWIWSVRLSVLLRLSVSHSVYPSSISPLSLHHHNFLPVSFSAQNLSQNLFPMSLPNSTLSIRIWVTLRPPFYYSFSLRAGYHSRPWRIHGGHETPTSGQSFHRSTASFEKANTCRHERFVGLWLGNICVSRVFECCILVAPFLHMISNISFDYSFHRLSLFLRNNTPLTFPPLPSIQMWWYWTKSSNRQRGVNRAREASASIIFLLFVLELPFCWKRRRRRVLQSSVQWHTLTFYHSDVDYSQIPFPPMSVTDFSQISFVFFFLQSLCIIFKTTTKVMEKTK